MSIKSRKFQKGIRTKPTTDAATLEGEQRTDSADNKQKIFLDSAERAVVTEDQSQDLSNKSIDADNNTISNLETDNLKAGVLNTDLSGAATDTEIPSALAVKTALEGQNEASEINYDNSTSGLAATDVQAAIDEVEGRVDVSETNITELTTNQDDLITLSGVPENSVDLGTFAGSVIGDNVTVKTALSQLESAVSSTRITDVFVVADIAARDALTGIDEGDVAVVQDDGTGRRHSYIYDGSAWIDIKTGDQVFTVNGQTDDVVLDTDDVIEMSSVAKAKEIISKHGFEF